MLPLYIPFINTLFSSFYVLLCENIGLTYLYKQYKLKKYTFYKVKYKIYVKKDDIYKKILIYYKFIYILHIYINVKVYNFEER